MTLAHEPHRAANALAEDISAGTQRLIRRIEDYLAYRRTIAALSQLPAEKLGDLGLARGDIARVARETVYGRP